MYLKLTVTIFLFIITLCQGFSQQYSEDMRTFFFNKKTYRIVEDSADLSKVHIHVSETVNDKLVARKPVELNIGSRNTGLVSFGAYINKTRRFILVSARYNFFILNLYNDKIIGPVGTRFYGIGQDAQSGMLSGLKIIYDGRFIIGYKVDSGTFLIDLTNLYHPKERRSATNPYASKNKVFLTKNLEKPGKHLGILLTEKDWAVESKTLFTNKEIVSFEQPLHKLESNEEVLMNTKFDSIEYYYTILKEKISDETCRFIVYENAGGNQVKLPAGTDESDKEQVIKHLRNRQ